MGPRPDPLGGDTIAAIATAPGRSAVAMVRISGPDAGRVLLELCPALEGSLPTPRLQRLLSIRHPESAELVDRALVTFFAGPASFTGEDSVEISTHGGLVSPQLVLAAACAAGARLALEGEFTHRALHHGKLDLTQAEALLDLIDGSSPAMHRAAIHQMEGGLSRRIDELRSSVLRAEALLAYGIDFPEEDEPPVPPRKIVEAVEDTLARIELILLTAPHGVMLRDGALVVLAGYPNSGKSSLFNALLGIERSIVTEIPGTTRDAVEAPLTLQGFPFRLVDTAGLRQTEDPVEERGIEFAHRYLRSADSIIYCVDATRTLSPGDLEFLEAETRNVLLVRTKVDLGAANHDESVSGRDELRVSALTGEGLGELSERLVASNFGAVRERPREMPLVTRERHVRALRQASTELSLFLEATRDDTPAEMAATHLRIAAVALEEMIGALLPDDVLAAVFSQFCVGK